MLATQDTVQRLTPDVVTQITHEIYWNTPGCPADLAALKHAPMYHIPPNNGRNSGAGTSRQPAGESWGHDHKKLYKQVITSSLFMRQQYYAHRGLPLYCCEFYGAGAVNFRNIQVQDRQVCSSLMGTPMVFTGDLKALETGDIARYHELFEIIAMLQKNTTSTTIFSSAACPSRPTRIGTGGVS